MTLAYSSHLLDYKSKKIKVNLSQPTKAEVKAESIEILKGVDEDRKYSIQATIVRYVCHDRTFLFASDVWWHVLE